MSSYRAKHSQYLQMCNSLGRLADVSLAPTPPRMQQQHNNMAGSSTLPPVGGRGAGGGRVGRPPGSGRGRGRPPGPGRGRGRPPVGSPVETLAFSFEGDLKRTLPGEGLATVQEGDVSQRPTKRERCNDGGGASPSVAMSMADMPAQVAVVCNGVRGVLVLSSMRISSCGCSECGAKGPPESRPLFHPTHWEQHCGKDDHNGVLRGTLPSLSKQL